MFPILFNIFSIQIDKKYYTFSKYTILLTIINIYLYNQTDKIWTRSIIFIFF